MKMFKNIFSLFLLLGLISSCEKVDDVNTSVDTLDFTINPEFPFVGMETKFKVNDPYRFDHYKYIISDGNVDNNDTLVGTSVAYTFEKEGTYSILLSVLKGDEYVKAREYTMDLKENKYVAPKTMYVSTAGVPFSSVQGQLYSIDLSTPELKKVPLEVECGQNANTLQWANDRLYFFSAGDRFQYSPELPSSEDNLGFIKSFDPLLYSTTTHIVFSDKPYDDAFAGYVTDGYIYWSDRNHYVAKIPQDDTNRQFTSIIEDETNTDENGIIPEWFFASAASNPLYDAGSTSNITMGTGSGYTNQIMKIGDEWWITKNHEGDRKKGQKGLWKLIKDEEMAELIVQERGVTYGASHSYVWLGQHDNTKVSQILEDYFVSNFVIYDNTIYFTCSIANGDNPGGVYKSNIDGSNVVMIEEFVKGVQLYNQPAGFYSAIVVDEDLKKVFWTQTNNDAVNPSGFSGVKSYDIINGGSPLEEVAIDKPLGIAIAPAYLE